MLRQLTYQIMKKKISVANECSRDVVEMLARWWRDARERLLSRNRKACWNAAERLVSSSQEVVDMQWSCSGDAPGATGA